MLNKSLLHGRINRAFPVCGVQLDYSFIIIATCENTSHTLKSIAASVTQLKFDSLLKECEQHIAYNKI